MNEKALSEKVRLLQKAVTGGDPPTTIIAMLSDLKKAESPSEQTLRITQAGKLIGKLRSNTNKEIASAAQAVVHKWKQSVEASKARAKMASPPTGTPSNIASPAHPSIHFSNQRYQGDPETRHFKADKVDVKRTASDARNNCIGVMYNGLAYRSTEPVEAVLAKAVEAEAAAYKYYSGEGSEYRAKIRSLFSNLKVKSNRQLGVKVMSGEIAAADFIKMTQDELKSQEHQERDNKLKKENMNNAQVAKPEKSISDALTCGKCGQKKVSYSQAQTRSADEPMTTFCECMVCGNRWKFS